MMMRNQTTEFILLGLTKNPDLKIPLFLLFLMIYTVTLISNGGMIALIRIDPHLWTPMYRFISHLSLVDLFYSSTITPKMLINFIEEKNTISFNGCMAQLYFYTGLAGAESFLQAAMGYDRYAAICLPLRYTSIMTEKACLLFPMACYILAFMNTSVHTGLTARLSFCRANEIHHFFCNYHPLYQLSCSDTHINRLVLFVSPLVIGLFSTFIILMSYVSIFHTIMKMHSIAGRLRAFSTCSSQFTAMTLFYGTAFSMALQSSENYVSERDMVLSLFYTVIIALINPLIYSMRNKDIKKALKMMIGKIHFSHQ